MLGSRNKLKFLPTYKGKQVDEIGHPPSASDKSNN